MGLSIQIRDGVLNLIASRPFAKGKLICVFGCGGDRDRGKRPQMGDIACKLADQIMLTSDNPRTEDPFLILEDVLAGMSTQEDLSQLETMFMNAQDVVLD